LPQGTSSTTTASQRRRIVREQSTGAFVIVEHGIHRLAPDIARLSRVRK